MKKYGVMLLALLACGAVYATQDATLTQREVRDPRQLEVILEANATDAETRIAAVEAGTSIALASNKVFIGSSAGLAVAKTLVGVTVDVGGTGAVDAAYITAATTLSAVDINAATNIDMANLASGTTAAAFDGQNITALDAANLTAASVASAIDGGAITGLTATAIEGNIAVAQITNAMATGTYVVDAARLLATSTAPAIDGGAITNLDAANIAATTSISAINGTAITNIAGGNISSGDIASDRLTANGIVVTDFSAAGDVLVGTGSGTFGAIAGFETNITFSCNGATNVLYFGSGGILTNVVVNP